MNICLLDPRTEEAALIKELEQALHVSGRISNKASVLNVKAEKSAEKGYRIIPNADGTCSVQYSSLPTLCKALVHLWGADEAQPVSEKCAFDDFGVMYDISRNAVPTVKTFKKLAAYAACMGYGFIGVYMEDLLEVPGEPYFGYMRGRLTYDEIREIVEYAEIFGVETRPYIQTLAHINQITRYEEYGEITDTKDILLAGAPRTAQLIENIIRQAAKCFDSYIINIGMDEADLVGAGKYADAHGLTEKSVIMEQHLNTVLEICRKYGFEPQMWSDFFIHSYEKGRAAKVPSGLKLIYWDYYSTSEQHYADRLESHKSFAPDVGFAGGAWKWTGFAPHNKYSTEIGRAAMAACKKAGVQSYTVTCWGDNGAEASVFSVLPALFEDAACAYGAKADENEFYLLTGYTLSEFMQLDTVNPYSDEISGHNNASKYLLYNDPLIGTFDSTVLDDTAARFGDASQKLQALAEKDGEFGYIFAAAAALTSLLAQKADLGCRIKSAYDAQDKAQLLKLAQTEIPAITAKTESFYSLFKAQWSTENKAFGFEVQTVRIGGLLLRLKDTAQRLARYANGEIDCIEELAQPRLPFMYFRNNDIRTLNYNMWSDIASPSVMG